MMDLLAASAKEKKGVTVYVKGQQIGMLVTQVGLEFVEGGVRRNPGLSSASPPSML